MRLQPLFICELKSQVRVAIAIRLPSTVRQVKQKLASAPMAGVLLQTLCRVGYHGQVPHNMSRHITPRHQMMAFATPNPIVCKQHSPDVKSVKSNIGKGGSCNAMLIYQLA